MKNVAAFLLKRLAQSQIKIRVPLHSIYYMYLTTICIPSRYVEVSDSAEIQKQLAHLRTTGTRIALITNSHVRA